MTVALFWAKVDRSGGPDSCWLWTAAIRSAKAPYGAYNFDGRFQLAHRVSWQLKNGPLPKWTGHKTGICVLHKCDVPLCVNPAHLFLGTSADNSMDRKLKGRASRGVKRHNAVLTPDLVRAIRADNRPLRVVGRAFGINQKHVFQIRKRQLWAHVEQK